MLRYEVLFLTVPEVTGAETDSIKEYFSKSIRGVKADMLSFERWGKYRLAYPVQKNVYGVYFLVRFDVEGEKRDTLLEKVKEGFSFKFNTLVMKHVVTRLDSSEGLEYSRPESLEDNPNDVDSFLKKNDMGGLINKSSGKTTAPAKEKAVEAKAEATQEVAKTETAAKPTETVEQGEA